MERDVSSKDGRSYIARVLPYRSIDNFIAGAVITFVDVTTTVRAEAALRESEARLRLLLSELQHRVRNTLGLVKSITKRTAQSSGSVEEMERQLSGRLDAFARVQAAVTRNPDEGVDLKSLLSQELLAHGLKEGPGLSIKGSEVRLNTRSAEAVSLAVHELVTNAVKHGGIGGKDGKIVVSWKLVGDGSPSLQFDWREESGNGGVVEPKRKGFGFELLTRGLPYELGGKTNLKFEPGGLRFSMEVPGSTLFGSEQESAG
jgi:two-component system CheB/CheR fusion protein